VPPTPPTPSPNRAPTAEPRCLKTMGCLCAGHARGNPASAACDTSEAAPAACPKCRTELTDQVHDPDGRRVCGECGHAWDEPAPTRCLNCDNDIETGGCRCPEGARLPQQPVTDLDVLDAMERYGGGFVSALAVAWRKADDDNRRRLRGAFPHYWEQYTAAAQNAANRRVRGGA
jgi:hypothetical protein